MKPDWQNKSFAKSGSPAGPSTTHPKLKLGMSSLHSKIAVANHNTVQSKPAAKKPVRKFADGGNVTTLSDTQLWWQNQPGNRGRSYPGDEIAQKQYERNQAAGEKNLSMLRSGINSVLDFVGGGKKSDQASPNNIVGDTMSESDKAKKEAMSGPMPYEQKSPTETTSTATAEEPAYMKDVREAITKPKEAPAPVMPEAKVEQEAKPVEVKKVESRGNAKPVVENKLPPAPKTIKRSNQSGQSQKDIEALVLRKKGLAGNEAMKAQEAAPAPTIKASSQTFKSSGRVPTPEEAAANRQLLLDKTKKAGESVVDYFKNFETPAERRSRLAKEARK